MNFRKGRRLKRTDKLTYLGDPVEFVNSFCYLGVSLATQSNPNKHFNERKQKGIKQTKILAAKVDIRKLSFVSAHKLFCSVVLPSATYGIRHFAETPDLQVGVGGFLEKMV